MLAIGVIFILGAIVCQLVMMSPPRGRSDYRIPLALIMCAICLMIGTMLLNWSGSVTTLWNDMPLRYVYYIGCAVVAVGVIVFIIFWRHQQSDKRFQTILEEFRNKK